MRTAIVAVMVLAGLAPRAVVAEENDLVLSRLGAPQLDGAGQVTRVVGNNGAFRSLVSELGVVMAPRLLEPADSLGFGGFQLAVDSSFTSISSGASYWAPLEGNSNGFMQTFGVFVRKGLWLPLPSFELGMGAIKLAASEMWAAQTYAKFAVHEGFHRLPLPSIAIRGAASRLMGSDQLDLTIASVDVSASKEIGLGGVINLAPYGGWNYLIMVPRSKVLDRTPHVDQLMDPADSINTFIFVDQDNITRHRFFAGAKLKYWVFIVTAEANIALAGSSIDDRGGTSDRCSMSPTTEACDAEDASSAQQTYTFSVGVDF